MESVKKVGSLSHVATTTRKFINDTSGGLLKSMKCKAFILWTIL